MTDRARLQTKLHDSLAAFNATACWDVLRLPQMRQYLAEHLAEALTPELPDGFKHTTCVTVACAACGYAYDEAEFTMHFPSVGDALDGAVGSGWDELKDGRVLCEAFDDKHEEMRNTVGVADPDAESAP